MCFLIAALALLVALLTGAFIAPQVGNHCGLRVARYALEIGDWSAIDPNCTAMPIRTRSGTLGKGPLIGQYNTLSLIQLTR